MISRAIQRAVAVPTLGLAVQCEAPLTCGPSSARVERVIDGDTVLLEGGERVRYLLVDAPESTGTEPACFGPEATQFNRDLVERRDVSLAYDVACRDKHDRLLAYVSLDGLDVSAALLERGYACLLHIPPNGAGRVSELRSLEDDARRSKRGLWGACPKSPCAR
jgi:micrococcal nuclease